MSGICGIVRSDGKPVKNEEVQKMIDGMTHSGSDTEGIWIDGSVGLGHKMLWTTPESLHENQPLINQDGNLVLIADARIDNRYELFEQLNLNVNDDSIVTDADLILMSYEKWGEESPENLIGDFSYAIWDNNEKKLFCARDRLGMKPLIYTQINNSFLFSSEISGISALNAFEKKPNLNAFESFFKIIGIKHHETFFENIYRLPPASKMIIKEGKISIIKYWEPENFIKMNTNSIEENGKIFMNLLERSIKDRLRSAYPIGIEVSGGLDSSAILLLANRFNIENSITSLSMRYKGMDCDENKYIEEVLKKVEFPSILLDFNAIEDDHFYYDEYYDFAPDWPAWGMFFSDIELMKESQKNGIRIILTGQGGDHVMEGNPLYVYDDLKNRRYIKVIKEIYKSSYRIKMVKNILKFILPTQVKQFLKKFKSQDLKKSYFKFAFGKADNLKYISNRTVDKSLAQELQMILGEQSSFITDSIMNQVGGSFDIERRHPFFDSRIIEFALSIPKEQKYSEKLQKLFYRTATKGLLPELIRNRSDKATFTLPTVHILKQNCDKEFFNTLELEKIGLVNNKAKYDIIHKFDDLEDVECTCVSQINLIVTIEYWLKKHFKDKKFTWK